MRLTELAQTAILIEAEEPEDGPARKKKAGAAKR